MSDVSGEDYNKEDSSEESVEHYSSNVIFAHPFRLLVTGRSGSGKTYATVELIKKFVIKQVHRVYAFVPTYNQPAYRSLDRYVKPEHRALALTKENLDMVQKHQAKKERRILILIDDCAGEYMSHRGRKGILNHMIFICRHINCSIVMITQNLTAISPVMRDNTEYLMVFYTINQKELKVLTEEFSVRKEMFLQAYEAAIFRTNTLDIEPYSFLFVTLMPPVRYFYKFEAEIVLCNDE